MKSETDAARVLTTFPLFMHKMFHDFHADSGELQLNRTQMKTLMVIYMEHSPHMSQVCYHMNMEKGSLTPVVDTLLELGLLQRERNPADRRKVILSLTDRGHALVVENLHQVHRHILERLKHLPKEDVQRFKRAMLDLHEITLKL